MTLAAFIFLIASFLSLWIWQEPKIWGSLLGLSLVCGVIAGHINWVGLVFILILWLLWARYAKQPSVVLFIAIICISLGLKMRLLPGYTSFFFTPNFSLGLEGSLIGLFPLAFLVPLARKVDDWRAVMKGLLVGCVGIGVLMVLATLSGAVHWDFKLPTFAVARIMSNFFLTSIPEEGFYRGLIQNRFCNDFGNKTVALFATSILFTAAHIYWSPSLPILLFVFLASLLYGGVYLISGKIESAILCHFLLNFIHMTFFSYHAL